MAKKKPAVKATKCNITRKQFNDKAEPVAVNIGDQKVTLDPREFSTGSFGWYYNGKLPVEVDGKQVKVQVNLGLYVVGSKDVN